MKNKRGEGYVFVCVIIMIICMVVSVFITLANSINVIKMTERNSRVVLDNLVMRGAIDVYDSIKNGNDNEATLEEEYYIDELCSFCTFERKGNFLYANDENGQEMFRLSIPKLRYIEENQLKICVSYDVSIPLYFCGIRVSTTTVPVTVESKYIEKF